ncbi:hypothetical protein IPJ72_02715 [Candidatus Peregrinibacteria bacterium]|nr:MAG: hypothetical protein IPJ72_02715 [Candidatus Peregrinibacteria bacterium]
MSIEIMASRLESSPTSSYDFEIEDLNQAIKPEDLIARFQSELKTQFKPPLDEFKAEFETHIGRIKRGIPSELHSKLDEALEGVVIPGFEQLAFQVEPVGELNPQSSTQSAGFLYSIENSEWILNVINEAFERLKPWETVANLFAFINPKTSEDLTRFMERLLALEAALLAAQSEGEGEGVQKAQADLDHQQILVHDKQAAQAKWKHRADQLLAAVRNSGPSQPLDVALMGFVDLLSLRKFPQGTPFSTDVFRRAFFCHIGERVHYSHSHYWHSGAEKRAG